MDNEERTANLLGALALALADAVAAETAASTGRAGAAPAAVVTIGVAPGEPIEALAETVGLSHSAAVRLVDRLVEDGLVERRAARDGRVSALHLTRRGRARRREILAGRLRVIDTAIRGLTRSDRDTLAALLEQLLKALTRDREHADWICRLCDEDVCPMERCPVEDAAVRWESGS